MTDERLTLNEAVDLLNCSRDFTLGLIARGEIDLTRVSVLAYRERDDAERKAAADDVARLGQEIDAAAELPMLPEHDMAGLTEMLNEYSQIAAKAFAASRLTDAAGDPIYSDYQDWYQNGDWHTATEEADPA